MKLSFCRFLFCCQWPDSPRPRDSSTQLQVSEAAEAPQPSVLELPAPLLEDPAPPISLTEPEAANSDCAQDAEVKQSQSMVFAEDQAVQSVKRDKRKHDKKKNKTKKKEKAENSQLEKKHTPPPRDAKPGKSILKKVAKNPSRKSLFN